MSIKAVAIIPARYSSLRLPGKPLKLLDGVPLICRVYNSVKRTGLFSQVIVATDTQSIIDALKDINGQAVMTSAECQSGTDRIVSIAGDIDCDVIFNVQGDEPFIKKEELAKLLDAFNDEEVKIASLMNASKESNSITELHNPNVVKVVPDRNDFALYFSRSLVPYNRDCQEDAIYYKHIGVYAFRKEVLQLFPNLPQGVLENTEMLEQLRWLENGYRIKMIATDYEGFGIDTPEDLEKAEKLLAAKKR